MADRKPVTPAVLVRVREGFQPKIAGGFQPNPVGEVRKGYQPQQASTGGRGTPPSGDSNVKPSSQGDKPGK